MRKKIVFEVIKKIPGITYNEIVRETNLSNGVISHYLIKLLENKEIEKEGIKRGKYFIKNVPKKDRELITLLRSKTNNEIFKILMRDSNDKVFIFNGWTFSSSSSIRPFDHPVYDIWLLKCF